MPPGNKANKSNKSDLLSDTTHGEPEVAVVVAPARNARIDGQVVRGRGIVGRT